MSKTTRFDIHSGAPEGDITFCKHPAKFAGSSNTKRKANFSLHPGSPEGGQGTFQDGNQSHIDFPKASTKPKDLVISTSSGQGKYSPSPNAIKSGSSYTGRPGISPKLKSGAHMKTTQGFSK